MTALTLDDLFASPDHYLHSLNGDAAVFVPMNRVAYHHSIFLDHRIAAARGGAMRVPLASLAGGWSRPAATGWIFHIAHCGSTLLARALDRVDDALVLREPLALRQIALAPDHDRLALVLTMLGKRYHVDRPTIVKANVPVNFLLADIAMHDPAARAILLHLSPADYLRAILRTPDHRGWLRRVTGQLVPRLGDLSTLPDAELAAALWLAQTRSFAAALATMPNARSLDAEVFFNRPAATLVAVAAHLDMPMSFEQASEIVAGALFSTYSKDPGKPFDNTARLLRAAEAGTALTEEIARAEAWLVGQHGVAAAVDAVAKARLG